MISEERYDALLGDLYAGVIDRHCMEEFLRKLGLVTGSHVTTMVRADLADPSASALLTIGAAPEEVLRWSEHAGKNPWMERYKPEIHAGGVCNGDAYVTHKKLVASQYYDGFLRYIDTEHSVGICAAHDRNRAAFLMLCRSGRMGAYGEDCTDLFQRLAPHVVNAFALQMQFEQLHAQASHINRHQRGMFLLDAQWRWVGGNSVAERMVAAGWWRGRLKSGLEPVHHDTRAAWKSLQRDFQQASAIPAVVPVHDAKGVLVAFASVHAYGAAAISQDLPSYMLFVRPLRLPDGETIDAKLRQLFGLTASEALFVVALRKQGDPARAASVVGIAESTGRTRLQSIFDKTGVHRQADLMSMMDALAEALA